VAPVALEDLADLTDLRTQIEIEALRRSIRRGDDAWRRQLQQAYDDLSIFEQPVLAEHRKRWEALNTRFHGRSSAHALRSGP
jgi:DNA-binding GntR family transcriptional regulator